MEVDISQGKVIPDQDLEGKIGYVGKIIELIPCNFNGEKRAGYVTDGPAVKINLKHAAMSGNSLQVYNMEEFARFMDAYKVLNHGNLISKMAICVYHDNMIQGLIPLK